MKRIIKFVLSSAVFASMTVSMMSFSAFGASKPNPDPTGNGVSDIADVVFLGGYLNGNGHVSNPDALDINNDGIISQADVYAMQRYLAHMDY